MNNLSRAHSQTKFAARAAQRQTTCTECDPGIHAEDAADFADEVERIATPSKEKHDE